MRHPSSRNISYGMHGFGDVSPNRLVCWSLTSLCHSNGHIETMPAREINPFTALTRIRSQFLRTQWSTSNHQRVDTTTHQTAQPSGLALAQIDHKVQTEPFWFWKWPWSNFSHTGLTTMLRPSFDLKTGRRGRGWSWEIVDDRVMFNHYNQFPKKMWPNRFIAEEPFIYIHVHSYILY